jgi:hypothetical protein
MEGEVIVLWMKRRCHDIDFSEGEECLWEKHKEEMEAADQIVTKKRHVR